MIARLSAISLGAVLCAAPAFSATCESLSFALAARHDDHAGAAGGGRSVSQLPRRTRRAWTARRTAYKDLPAFCRVAATIKPTSDSDIKMEIWLPASGWNGKLEANGNGGWTGSIAPATLARAWRAVTPRP